MTKLINLLEYSFHILGSFISILSDIINFDKNQLANSKKPIIYFAMIGKIINFI